MKVVMFIISIMALLFIGHSHAYDNDSLHTKYAIWNECASAEAKVFVSKGEAAVEKALCYGVFALPPGPKCDESAESLMKIGVLHVEVSKYILNEVIIPKCGEPPR